nr:hypothetical protein [uncultured Kingella sp.]
MRIKGSLKSGLGAFQAAFGLCSGGRDGLEREWAGVGWALVAHAFCITRQPEKRSGAFQAA